MKTVLRKYIFFIFLIFFSLCIFRVLLFSQDAPELPFPVQHVTLKNGLTVILAEDDSLPVVSIVIEYRVGSLHDPPGKAGLAYLLENFMFQGSQNVGRMQHFSFINRTGGRLSAYTTEDKTVFYQTVPSNRLELILWLESDRMNALDIKEYKVEQAKQTLIEEISQRMERDPYLKSALVFDEILFRDHSFSHPVFGSRTDLRSITVGDVQSFYETYYVPNNAVLCIAGHFDRAKTVELVQKYFGSIPAGEVPDPPGVPDMPPSEPSVHTLEKSLVPSPGFYLGFRIPAPGSPDFYPVKIIEYLLVKGKSSRILNRLQQKEKIVISWTGYMDIRDGLAFFKFFVLTSNEILAEKSLKAVQTELDTLKGEIFLIEPEITKAKNMFRMDYINQFSTSLNKALFLGESYLYRKELEHLSGELDKFMKVKPYEILRALNRYFSEKAVVLHVTQR